MAHRSRSLLAVLSVCALAQTACLDFDTRALAERHVRRSFTVAAGSLAKVDLASGGVTVVTGPEGELTIDALARAWSTGGERAAAEILDRLDLTFSEASGVVHLAAGYRPVASSRNRIATNLDVTLTVPASVRLDVDTRGGSITVRGLRAAEVRADTSGGSITVDGGRSLLALTTSGGRIRVGQALGTLRAGTSGGSIAVGYVGTSAGDIELGTSGGSIDVRIDPAVSLAVTAETSGGRVEIDGLPFDGRHSGRSQATGTLNGGTRGSLRASTSGGSITLRAAVAPESATRSSAVATAARR
jgi:hypothetical protein